MGDLKKIQELEDMSRLLEKASVSVHLVGKDGTILWANDAEIGSLGYTHDEFVDHSITEFHADQKVISDILHKLSNGDTLIDYPAQLVCKNGEIRDVLINSNVYWVDGEFVHTRCFTRDITERKRAEAKLLESNQRLGKNLEKLRQNQQQVVRQERPRVMSTMARSIAHNLNTSLAPILGFSELLLEHPDILDDREKCLHYLQGIHTSAESASEVVGLMREFCSNWKEVDLLLPVDLDRVASEAASITRPRWRDMAQSSGVEIELHTELEPGLPFVSRNESDLRTAITNLVLNAVEAVADGGRITISTSLDGDTAVVKVTGTGTGMPEEVRKRALEPFFSTNGGAGTGLGLAMVDGIITQHGGAIDIESEMGRGTAIAVRQPARGSEPVTHVTRSGDKRTIGALHVLVVDDQPVVLDVLTEYLRRDGHTVETASNGLEALDKFNQGKFDLFLVDRAMPTIGGDELAGAIKNLAPDLPVIMVTGFGEMMEAVEERPRGVDLILSKPLTPVKLRQALARLFSSQNLSQRSE